VLPDLSHTIRFLQWKHFIREATNKASSFALDGVVFPFLEAFILIHVKR